MNKIGRTIRRRRKEGKTDYLARLQLLRSFKPRIIVRKTNRHIIAQLVTSDIAQDKVIIGANSRDLLGKGWPVSLAGSLKSIPAAYLTGLLLAHNAHGKFREAVLDTGLQRNIKKGRIYAVLSGLVAGGLAIPHDASIVPDEKRLLENTKTREAFIKVKEAITHGRKGNQK